MIAIDTNVLVRIVTNDDPAQARRAAALFESEAVFIPKSVLLESEWVLRYAYELPRDVIAAAFRNLLGLPRVRVEDPHAIANSIAWHEQGVDFADALHLASSVCANGFASFDSGLIKRATALATIPVRQP